MVTYLLISVFVLLASTVLNIDKLVISPSSSVPLVLVLLSIIQAALFYASTKEHSDLMGLNYTKEETDQKAVRRRMKCHAQAKLTMVPPILLLCVYFSSVWKVLFSVLLYAIGYLIGYVLSNITHGE